MKRRKNEKAETTGREKVHGRDRGKEKGRKRKLQRKGVKNMKRKRKECRGVE